jgi:hypothetical protein
MQAASFVDLDVEELVCRWIHIKSRCLQRQYELSVNRSQHALFRKAKDALFIRLYKLRSVAERLPLIRARSIARCGFGAPIARNYLVSCSRNQACRS